MSRPQTPFLEMFTVDPETACWTWSMCRNKRGYGTVNRDGKSRLAHRVVYEFLVGPVPEGLVLDHLCCNRACVNPAHLEPVTNRENVLRWSAVRPVCRNGHRLTEETWGTVDGEPGCLVCRRARRDRFNEQRRLSRRAVRALPDPT